MKRILSTLPIVLSLLLPNAVQAGEPLSKLIGAKATSFEALVRASQQADQFEISQVPTQLPAETKVDQLAQIREQQKRSAKKFKLEKFTQVTDLSFAQLARSELTMNPVSAVSKKKPAQKKRPEQKVIQVAVQKTPGPALKQQINLTIPTLKDPIILKEQMAVVVPKEIYSLKGLATPASQSQAIYRKQAQLKTKANDQESLDADFVDPVLVDDERYLSSDFVMNKSGLNYVSAQLRFVDDRSRDDQSRVFPVPGLRVRIAGTNFQAVSDRLGYVDIDNIPSFSRYIVLVDDPLGRVRSAIFELLIDEKDEEYSAFLKLQRNNIFDAYTRVAGSVQHNNLASICGVVKDERQDSELLAGVSLTVDVESEGPFYFNRFGYLDPRMNATGADGRFCFLNVDVGPVAFNLFDQEQHMATHLIGLTAGRHMDTTLYANETADVQLHLAAQVTAHEQIGMPADHANSLKLIDMVDVTPLGLGESMTYLDTGLVGIAGGAPYHQNRVFAVAQAAEFESTLYALAVLDDEEQNIAPLLPRGFVEDLSLYAQIPYFPEYGSLMVEYGQQDNEGEGSPQIHLAAIDELGKTFDRFDFADKPVAKTVFFNLEPGKYVVLVESTDGYWLAADTVYIFDETVSYVRLGSRWQRQFELPNDNH